MSRLDPKALPRVRELDLDSAVPDQRDREERELRLVDAYYHEHALEASEDPRPNTATEQADDDALLATIRRLACSPIRSNGGR